MSSDDPIDSQIDFDVSGTAPPPIVTLTGSLRFGDVCPGDLEEKEIYVCNTGGSNLEVSAVAFDPPCDDFTIINNPFPATVSPDFCMPVIVRYTPTTLGMHTCTLKVTSNDPAHMMVTVAAMGNTPAPSIDVPLDVFFPPTVINTIDACESAEPFPVSNTGQCDLQITNLAITDNSEEYALEGLPSFPIILQPGHIAGQGDLDVVLAPLAEARERRGEVSVTYVSNPLTGAATTVTRDLCGEATRTGARVLVTYNGVPVEKVKQIQLRRVVGNANQSQVDTVGVALNVVLQSVTAAAPCQPFEFHVEYGTVDTEDKLLPGVYLVTVKVQIPGQSGFSMQTVGFDLHACDFNPTIIVEF